MDPNSIFITPEWLDKIKYKVQIDNIILELIQGYPIPYEHTTFGKTEFLTHNLDVDFLDLN